MFRFIPLKSPQSGMTGWDSTLTDTEYLCKRQQMSRGLRASPLRFAYLLPTILIASIVVAIANLPRELSPSNVNLGSFENGARIIEAYTSTSSQSSSWFPLVFGKVLGPPIVVLKEPIRRQQCWSLQGQRNTLGILLSHPGLVQMIGIEHSVEDFIENGVHPPDRFRVWATKMQQDKDIPTIEPTSGRSHSLVLLGSFELGSSTSKLAHNLTITATHEVVRELIIEFICQDNERRCLYGFRVYGQTV
jgi:hypothetical protein